MLSHGQFGFHYVRKSSYRSVEKYGASIFTLLSTTFQTSPKTEQHRIKGGPNVDFYWLRESRVSSISTKVLPKIEKQLSLDSTENQWRN